MEDSGTAATIYVLPTEPGFPPRAIVGTMLMIDGEMEGLHGKVAIFSRDSGCWMFGGTPVDDELNEAITNHARSLGVDL
jgi:hypothetical protein